MNAGMWTFPRNVTHGTTTVHAVRIENGEHPVRMPAVLRPPCLFPNQVGAEGAANSYSKPQVTM